MRLTLSVLKQLAPGNINNGRNRMWPKVTRYDLRVARDDMVRTEKNMLLLRHPYLSLKESYGHEESLSDPQQIELNQKIEEMEEKNRKNRVRDVTLDERLLALRKTDHWD